MQSNRDTRLTAAQAAERQLDERNEFGIPSFYRPSGPVIRPKGVDVVDVICWAAIVWALGLFGGALVHAALTGRLVIR